MKPQPGSHIILMVDDDEDDCLLVRNAFEKCGFSGEMLCVEDGEDLLDYLHQRGEYADAAKYPRPDIILLDLNMPRMDGRQALKAMKSDPRFRHIPVVIFTTSNEPSDIRFCYDTGANSFMTKPSDYKNLVEALETFRSYWFDKMRLRG